MQAYASETAFNLSDAQRLDWLRLIRSENVGPRTFRTLLNRFGGAAAALEALPTLAKVQGRTIRIAPLEDCQQEFDAVLRKGARFVALGEPAYPPALRMIDAPPPLITVYGSLDILQRPMVALVGSRNASAAGLAFTERLVRALGAEGHAIVSGLARGVDARAHRSSLQSGTIAVLAGGLDRIYPSEHVPLLDAIIENHGAAISEMPFGWEPRGRDFPRRNRLVSGLALGTIVVEAARRSGSLITARFAVEQGREVFAVPGSPLDPRAEGTNDLIRQGATMCTNPDDVIAALAPMVAGGVTARPILCEPQSPTEPPESLWDEWDEAVPAALSTPGQEFDEGPSQGALPLAGQPPQSQAMAGSVESILKPLGGRSPLELITELLGPSPVAVDDLVRISGLSAGLVQQTLFDLELSGRLERHGGTLVTLMTESAQKVD